MKKSYQYPEYLKAWRARNPEKQKAISDRARAKRVASGKRRVEGRLYRRKVLATPEGRLISNLRRRVNKAVHGILKSARTLELIGCPVKQLKAHLESHFKPGMSWENYGMWEIDHITPCARFNLSEPDQQRTCFHWSNLQPLWMTENRRKGDD